MSQPDNTEKHPLEADPDYDVHPLERRVETPEPVTPTPRPPKPRADIPYLTYVLIAINVLIFGVGFVVPEIFIQQFIAGSLFPPYVLREGEFYRLFTAMFLHADAPHVFFNMLVLYRIGTRIEPLFGRIRFALIYFLGGLAGSVLSVTLGDYLVPSVGASGAVFAVYIAELLYFYYHRDIYSQAMWRHIRISGIFIVFQIIMGFLPDSRIDNWGHIGGALGGLFLTWRISPRLQKPEAPISVKSMREFSQRLDSNRLTDHIPEITLFCLVLVSVMIFAVNFVGIGVVPQ